MKFTSLLALPAFAATALAAATATVTVSYDQAYDSSSTSLSNVACSDGSNGLLTKGFTTFGSLPKFPYIGGAAAIAGWNSASCGSCWTLTYNGTSINVLAIDHADSGFNIALAAMNKLTNGNGVQFGRVNAVATSAAKSLCGL